jgi:hypothetical protein
MDIPRKKANDVLNDFIDSREAAEYIGVTPAQLEKLANFNYKLPVQVLAAVANSETAAQTGVTRGAKLLSARLQLLTPDTKDVETINAKAVSDAARITNETRRWRDEGYLLIPFIVIGLLLWSMRGWSMGWI